MTLNLYHTTLKSEVQDVADRQSATETRINGASLSYSPYETLFFYGAFSTYERSMQDSAILGGTVVEARPQRTQQYQVSWSPAMSGNLWFGIEASETVTSVDDGKTSTVSPFARWMVNPKVTIETSYQWYSTKNVAQRTDQASVYARLRMVL
jgi:hypothetical protein